MNDSSIDNPAIVQSLLLTPTPIAWVQYAVEHLDILLVDQVNCEKKAASAAVSLLFRNNLEHHQLDQLSRLAREELRHFEMVIKTMQTCGVVYRPLSASRYAKHLHNWIRHEGSNERLLDQLIVAAMIEARSCERIGALLPALSGPISDLYKRLHESEGRHFEVYMEFASSHAGISATLERFESIRTMESQLVQNEDSEFRFHSGLPKI